VKRSLILAIGTLMLAAGSAFVLPSYADAEEKASDPRDRIICRRFQRTGSLADTYRVCKTRWEWERERENIRQFRSSESCREGGEGQTCSPS